MSKVPAGGPATINGVLYQMLWSLLRTTTLHATECTLAKTDHRLTGAMLRLEPKGGGGDLQELSSASVVVEQLKARPDGGTWSLQEVVANVLPDLFKAVDLTLPETRFRFVTEGRLGDWPEARTFFRSLKNRKCPEFDVLSGLDDRDRIKFRRSHKASASKKNENREPFWALERYTERSLFERIVAELREHPAIDRANTVAQIRRKLWHLLGRFEFVGGQTSEAVQKEVDRKLLDLGVMDTRLAEKRDAMLTGLARLATKGSADIVAGNFLAEYGLDSVPLSSWTEILSRGKNHLDGQLQRLGYVRADDVRRDTADTLYASWPDRVPLLVFFGESGVGKSWRLYALACVVAAHGELVVVVEASGDAARDLQAAAEAFCQDIKDQDDVIPINRIAARRKKLVHNYAERWLTLMIDGVQSIREARDLALQPWESWGVRLAVTCPPEVAEKIAADARGRCVVVPVTDFTPTEMDTYLTQRLGRDWRTIPADVRSTLRRPLAARLYCDLAAGNAWRPTNEYELYEAYWSERLRKGVQAPYPLDADRLGRVGQSLLDGGTYPWTSRQLAQAGLDNEAVVRLCRAGWLREAPGNRFEIWHDRLLNWAVAQGMVAAVQAGELESDTLCSRLRELFESNQSYGCKYLGYVPMDVVWTMADPARGLSDVLDRVVEALEQAAGAETDTLYAKLLPTVGERILPALFNRLAAAAAHDHGIVLSRVVDAIVFFDTDEIRQRANALLNGDSARMQRGAMRVLARRPTAQALDRLWELHCALAADPTEYLTPHERTSIWAYKDSFSALRACVQLDPAWLERSIQNASPDDPVHDLAYLLANLGPAPQLWSRCKLRFFELVPPSRERCIAVNLRTHRDAEPIDWLVERLGRSDGGLGASAMHALVAIDPDRAVTQLFRVPVTELYGSRHWCLAQLLAQRPEDVRTHLLQILQQSADPWQLAMVFQEFENSMDVPILEFLLDALERLLDDESANPSPPGTGRFYLPVSLLAAVHRVELLECFHRRRGTALEEKLTAWVLTLGPRRTQGVDRLERKPAVEVLYKIGGSGFTRIINSWLAADARYARVDGILLAAKRADDETVDRLRSIARQTEMWDGIPLEQSYAAFSLAAVGRWAEVIEVCVQWGPQLDERVGEMIRAYAPLEDDSIRPIAAALCKSDSPSPGVISAIGFAGQVDRVELMRSTFREANPESDLALACAVAVGDLRDESDDSLRLLACQLEIEPHCHAAWVALLKIGTASAAEVLLNHLDRHFDYAVAISLLGTGSTAGRALDLLRDHMADEGSLGWSGRLRAVLDSIEDERHIDTLLADESLRNRLREDAFAEESNFRIVGSKATAIRALARFDGKQAFLAARHALERPDAHDREFYPYLMTEIDCERAVPTLLAQARTEHSTAVTWAIGRALAEAGAAGALEDWLESPEAERRLAACRLAGRQPPSAWLREALCGRLDDVDDQVVRAALTALDLLRGAQEVENLVIEIATEQEESRKWVLLDSLIALGDPGDKHRPWPEWARRAAEHLPYAMRRYLGQRLKDRRNEAAKGAKSRNR